MPRFLRFGSCLFFALTSLVVAAETDLSDQFYSAIRRDDFASVDKLLAAGGVNVKDSRGGTPLMYATAVGSEAMMRRLIDAGADVNAKNSFDATALLWCGGSLARVKMLVDHGANVNVSSKQGHTPILLAAGHAGGLPVVELLLAKGATLKGPPDAQGNTPIAAAATTNDTALIKFLLDKGGKEILAGPGGPMALMQAAGFANAEIVKRLLSMGVDVNSVSPPEIEHVKNGPIAIGNLTALILAVAAGDTENVRVLLEAGANINARDVRGMTPLMLAIATDHPNHDIVKMLLARHPDTSVKSKAGETALDWALKFKQSSIVTAVRAASPGIEPANPPVVASTHAAAVDARAAIQKSVALMQTTGASNFKEGGCISCHGGNSVVSAVAAARRKGIAVDEKAAAETAKATRLQFVAKAEGMLERSDPPAVEILTYALSALLDDGVQPDRITDAMVHNIAAQQLGEGYWAYKGIVRPPTADHMFTNAAFAIRAFKQYAPPARQREYDERIARAAKALSSAEPSTTEDAVAQLLGLKWAGADPAKVQRLVKGVVALQRADGGWGQTPLLPSDAYATGTALYALSHCGVSTGSAESRKAVAFLLKTQAADGSWHVVSRAPKFQPYFEGGFPYGHDQWISQWATGWATIALSQTLPERRAAVR
jgi:ankyrin repeat protein